MRSGLLILVNVIVLLPVIALSADVTLTQDGRVPGAPFQALQQQIDALNTRLNALFNQSCPQGQFVVGISSTGSILCESLPQPPVVTIYMMDCPRSGDDPFDASHANFELEFAPALIGREITAVGVEASDDGSGAPAFVELKNAETGTVLATSGVMNTFFAGWIEFPFNPGFIINGTRLLVNFVAFNDTRTYNCENTATFIPSGMTAFGNDQTNHMARVYIKIRN